MKFDLAAKLIWKGGDNVYEAGKKDIASLYEYWLFFTLLDLLKEVELKNFRLDLYHRLGVIIIHVPSLNDRREDIPLLIDHFLHIVATEYGQPKKEIEKKAIEYLKNYNYFF